MNRFFFRFAARSRDGWFGSKYLNLRLVEDGGSVRIETAEQVHARLPRWCARADRRPPLGVLMAMLDEASTSTLSVYDRTGRFGVSVCISASLAADAPDLYPDDDLVFETHPKKIGRMMAFADTDVYAGDRLVLRGTHIKFLPVGVVVDNIGHPWLRPLSERYFEQVCKRWPIHASHDSDAFEDVATRSPFVVGRVHCNPTGKFHGGAACVIAERVAETSMLNQKKNGGGLLYPVASQTKLMLPLNPGEAAGLEASYLGPVGGGGENLRASLATIRASNGAPAVEAHIDFFAPRGTSVQDT